MRNLLLPLAVALFMLPASGQPAAAHPAFQEAFAAKYLRGSTPAAQAALKARGCNVCHVPGEARDRRNLYGRELRNRLTGNVKARLKRDKEKLMAELDAAFDKVGASKPAGSAQTYEELFRSGRFPQ